MKGRKHLTEQQKQGILRIYRETHSTRMTADLLNISIVNVRTCLKRMGEPLTGYRKTVCVENADLVVRLAQEGRSYSEIARTVGTTHHRVKEFLDRYAIEHPGHKQILENNPKWKGGRSHAKGGYVLVRAPNHPRANLHGYALEHHLVMEAILGRLLAPGETVHHIDGNPQNNAPDNLQLYASNADHLKETLKGKCPQWTPEGRERTLAGARRPRGHRHTSSQSPSSPGDAE